MKQSLIEKAQTIKNSRTEAANIVLEKIVSERTKKEQAILESFKSTFYEYIPMIEEEGIEISAHFKSAYEYQGSYIEFRKKDKILRMDYHDAITYRYEYTDPHRMTCRSVLGTWPKEDLILFIYDELLTPDEN
jgi:hypothetical protein